MVSDALVQKALDAYPRVALTLQHRLTKEQLVSAIERDASVFAWLDTKYQEDCDLAYAAISKDRTMYVHAKANDVRYSARILQLL